MRTVPFTRDLDIRNVANLPHGTGCKFLLCLHSYDDILADDPKDVLIAKQWLRKMPRRVDIGYKVVVFNA